MDKTKICPWWFTVVRLVNNSNSASNMMNSRYRSNNLQMCCFWRHPGPSTSCADQKLRAKNGGHDMVGEWWMLRSSADLWSMFETFLEWMVGKGDVRCRWRCGGVCIFIYIYLYIEIIYTYIYCSIHGGYPNSLTVCNGQSHWDGWFRGTPIYGNPRVYGIPMYPVRIQCFCPLFVKESERWYLHGPLQMPSAKNSMSTASRSIPIKIWLNDLTRISAYLTGTGSHINTG